MTIAEDFNATFGNNLEGFEHSVWIQAPENSPIYVAYRAFEPPPKKNQEVVEKATFSFKSIQGCRAVVVSYNTWVDESLRGKGVGTKMQAMKDWMARALNISMLMCTTVDNNNVQNHMLRKYGWELFFPLTNKFTTNKLLVWCKKYE